MRQYRERTQVKVVTSVKQAEAIAKVARDRGISKQALVREAIAGVTGVPNEFKPYPWNGVNGFAAYNERRGTKPEGGAS